MRNAPEAHPVGIWKLWFGLLGGQVAWTAHLLLSYSLASLACVSGPRFQLLGIGGYKFLIVLLTLSMAGVALAATIAALFWWRHTGPVGWRGFMAFAGMLLNGLFFAVIVFQGIPLLFFDPGACPGTIGQ